MSAKSAISSDSENPSLGTNDLQVTEDQLDSLINSDDKSENDDQTEEIFSYDSNSACSISSFESDLGSLSLNDEDQEEDEDQEVEDGRVAQVTDKIIKLFTVQKRKALIDQIDWDEDLVDYDTSVKRLFTFAFFLAFILALIATNLSIILVQDESSVIIHNSLISKVSQSIPHLVLLFNVGSIEIYEFSSSNTKLIHAWTFKVPHQKENLEENFNEQLEHHLGHTLLMSRSEIFIFYMSGKKDITILTNNAKANLTHQSIRQSKVPRNMFYNSKSLQIGNKLWLFGGMDQTVTTVPYNFYGYWYSNDFEVIQWKVSNKTLIWNLERQTYYPGPILPDVSIAQACPISINRTHTMMFYIDMNKNNCLDAWIYSFAKHHWSHLDECYYIKQSEEELRFNLMCTSYYDKDKRLTTLVALEAFERYLWTAASLDLLLIYFERDQSKVSKINHNFETSSK